MRKAASISKSGFSSDRVLSLELAFASAQRGRDFELEIPRSVALCGHPEKG